MRSGTAAAVLHAHAVEDMTAPPFPLAAQRQPVDQAASSNIDLPQDPPVEVSPVFFRFRAFPALRSAMAMLCLRGRPLRRNSRMLRTTVLRLRPFLSGTPTSSSRRAASSAPPCGACACGCHPLARAVACSIPLRFLEDRARHAPLW
jgi:hypothetical protein